MDWASAFVGAQFGLSVGGENKALDTRSRQAGLAAGHLEVDDEIVRDPKQSDE